MNSLKTSQRTKTALAALKQQHKHDPRLKFNETKELNELRVSSIQSTELCYSVVCGRGALCPYITTTISQSSHVRKLLQLKQPFIANKRCGTSGAETRSMAGRTYGNPRQIIEARLQCI